MADAVLISDEPILRADDIAAWDVWMRTAAVHARTVAFRRHVDGAKRAVERALAGGGRAAASISGGKDSSCLGHLVTSEMGLRDVRLLSEKDDLDFPGEEAYVTAQAEAWGACLTILRPPISPAAFIEAEARAGRLHVGDDIHGRAAALSKACFYQVMEEADRGYDVVMLGLRAEESGIRRHVRVTRGLVYPLRSRGGQLRANPLGDWKGIDVYAYAVSRGIELLPLYRCVAFMHAAEPWTLRKSWWLPGAGTSRGQVAWLARYWPSLYRKLLSWVPSASLFR
jgi:3'-phosphoadenosine 5'-phosphosulfate sulfotransferase (PAPS reductase)/FAD synthetase